MPENNDLATRPRKVFIFDDNLEILELCTEILEDLGCTVRTSPTTNAVETQLEEYQPDLILMDNWLPDLPGVEATRLIKSNETLRNIPVIYFSANSDIESLARRAGADDYLAKPFDVDHFETMVKKYLSK